MIGETKAPVKLNTILFACLLAGALALLLCLYQSSVICNCSISGMAADHFGIGRFGGFFLFFLTIALFCVMMGKERLFRFRYPIAAGCFILCVAFELTGSSIGCYAGEAENNLLLGVSRQIRSDEWGVLTPMTWSQYLDPEGRFSYYSSVVRAETTDVFLEYGLPIYTPLMVFKPFLLGYLFLPVAKGMAFFWCGRLIALALVSFEFGRFITGDKRMLALVYSVMIVFSPLVQWWFAINGLVEMLIFFQLSLLCFDRYLKDSNSWRRLLYVSLIGICAGGYVLTMYPAWMIPLAYVLFGCIIWVFYQNHKQGLIRKLNKKDLLSILFVLCLLALSAVYILNHSREAIETIANTVYPGHRTDNGGSEDLKHLFSFIPSIWYAVRVTGDYSGVYNNVCECSHFICLFPAGYMLFIYRTIKKGWDALSTIMVIVSGLLLIYCALGLPGIIADISLFKYSTSHRAIAIWGFANVILLIRLLALLSEDRGEVEREEEGKSGAADLLISRGVLCGMALLGIGASCLLNVDYYNAAMILIEALLFIPLYCLLRQRGRRAMALWAVFMISACMISGALANPVRSGVDDVRANPDVQMIRQIVKEDPRAVWIVEEDSFPVNNLPLLAGARTINCTNIYPDLERWRKVDPEGKYEDCYNRYTSFTQIILGSREGTEPRFVLDSNPVICRVYLSDREIKALGVKYILSRNDLSGHSLKRIAENGSHFVYEVEQ